jgi:hypothetical protein
MSKSLVRLTKVGGDVFLVEQLSRPTDPGFGGGIGAGGDPDYGLPDWAPGHPGNALPGHPVDPGWGGGWQRPDRPGNALPVPPVRPGNPIVLPPGVWPPQLPPGVDNTLPPEGGNRPIVIPPDPDVGIEAPIYLPTLPPGTALLIALPAGAQPKEGAPANAKPAILYQSGKKPVLVYISAAPMPK